ncbi:MAG: hypothetical protein AAFO93_02940 [Pseudomonadota bacterium]
MSISGPSKGQGADAPLPGLGHNRGPSMERGYAYRKHCWSKARAALVPTLPLMVLKMRVARAKELGLDYKTYAGVRASTGRDVIGFLFSSNALRLVRTELAEETGRKVAAIREAGKLALVHPPLDPAAVAEANPTLTDVAAAPRFTDPWPQMRDTVRGVIRANGLPSDGVLVIGDTTLEREWSDAGRTAGYLPADRYFGAAAP